MNGFFKKRFGVPMSRFLLALALLAVIMPAAALDSNRTGDARRIASPDEAVRRAVSHINKRYDGRVLSAQPVEGAGGFRVRVKFLSKDGVIKVLVVDPNED
jgi:hypothetical protein